MRSLYDVLEVSSTASQEAVEASYHRLSNKYLNLLNSESENFSEIQFRIDELRFAYETISNPQKRFYYDSRLITSTERAENDIFSSLLEFLKKPVVIFLVIFISLVVLIPSLLENKVAYTEVKANKDNNEKLLDVVDSSFCIEVELEKNRLKEQVKLLQAQQELLQAEQERKNKELEYQVELLRHEQRRRDKELEYKANAGDRVIGMHERDQEQKLKEKEAAEAFLDQLMMDSMSW